MVLAACAHAPVAAPAAPVAAPALPAGFAFDRVASWTTGPAGGRLRLDAAGRPYLITGDVLIPLARLPSGADATPFRIAGASPIGDATWVDDGVILLVVGDQLGTIGEHGFAPILALPERGMRAVAAARDKVWLFAPRATGDGTLFLYKRTGGLSAVLHARQTRGAPRR